MTTVNKQTFINLLIDGLKKIIEDENSTELAKENAEISLTILLEKQ
jgi:hypothetical protein